MSFITSSSTLTTSNINMLKENISKEENDALIALLRSVEKIKVANTISTLANRMSELSRTNREIIGKGQKSLELFLQKHSDIFIIKQDVVNVCQNAKQKVINLTSSNEVENCKISEMMKENISKEENETIIALVNLMDKIIFSSFISRLAEEITNLPNMHREIIGENQKSLQAFIVKHSDIFVVNEDSVSVHPNVQQVLKSFVPASKTEDNESENIETKKENTSTETRKALETLVKLFRNHQIQYSIPALLKDIQNQISKENRKIIGSDENSVLQFLTTHSDIFVLNKKSVCLKENMKKCNPTPSSSKKVNEKSKSFEMVKKNITEEENETIITLVKLIRSSKVPNTISNLGPKMSQLSKNSRKIIGKGQKSLQEFLEKHSDIFVITQDFVSIHQNVKHSLTCESILYNVECNVKMVTERYGFVRASKGPFIYFPGGVFEDGLTQNLQSVIKVGDKVIIDAKKEGKKWTATKVSSLNVIMNNSRRGSTCIPTTKLKTLSGKLEAEANKKSSQTKKRNRRKRGGKNKSKNKICDSEVNSDKFDSTSVLNPNNDLGKSDETKSNSNTKISASEKLQTSSSSTPELVKDKPDPVKNLLAKNEAVPLKVNPAQNDVAKKKICVPVEPAKVSKPKEENNCKLGGYVSKIVALFPTYGMIEHGSEENEYIYFHKDSVQDSNKNVTTLFHILNEGDQVLCDAEEVNDKYYKFIGKRIVPLCKSKPKSSPPTSSVSNLSFLSCSEMDCGDWKEPEEDWDSESNAESLYSCRGRIVDLFAVFGFIQRGNYKTVQERVDFDIDTIDCDMEIYDLKEELKINQVVYFDAIPADDESNHKWMATCVWCENQKTKSLNYQVLSKKEGHVLKISASHGLIEFGPNPFGNRVFFSVDAFQYHGRKVKSLKRYLKIDDVVKFCGRINTSSEKRTKWLADMVWVGEDPENVFEFDSERRIVNGQGKIGKIKSRKGVVKFENNSFKVDVKFDVNVFYDNEEIVDDLSWSLKVDDVVYFDAVKTTSFGKKTCWKGLLVWKGKKPNVITAIEKARKIKEGLEKENPFMRSLLKTSSVVNIGSEDATNVFSNDLSGNSTRSIFKTTSVFNIGSEEATKSFKSDLTKNSTCRTSLKFGTVDQDVKPFTNNFSSNLTKNPTNKSQIEFGTVVNQDVSPFTNNFSGDFFKNPASKNQNGVGAGINEGAKFFLTPQDINSIESQNNMDFKPKCDISKFISNVENSSKSNSKMEKSPSEENVVLKSNLEKNETNESVILSRIGEICRLGDSKGEMLVLEGKTRVFRSQSGILYVSFNYDKIYLNGKKCEKSDLAVGQKFYFDAQFGSDGNWTATELWNGKKPQSPPKKKQVVEKTLKPIEPTVQSKEKKIIASTSGKSAQENSLFAQFGSDGNWTVGNWTVRNWTDRNWTVGNWTGTELCSDKKKQSPPKKKQVVGKTLKPTEPTVQSKEKKMVATTSGKSAEENSLFATKGLCKQENLSLSPKNGCDIERMNSDEFFPNNESDKVTKLEKVILPNGKELIPWDDEFLPNEEELLKNTPSKENLVFNSSRDDFLPDKTEIDANLKESSQNSNLSLPVDVENQLKDSFDTSHEQLINLVEVEWLSCIRQMETIREKTMECMRKMIKEKERMKIEKAKVVDVATQTRYTGEVYFANLTVD